MARKARRRGRRGGQRLNTLSTAALRAELDRRQSQVNGLVTRHRELSAELARIESELSALGVSGGAGRAGRAARGRPPGRGAGRPRSSAVPAGRKRHQNDSNLEEALAKVLKGKTMGVTEVAQAVQQAGYRTTSPNFRTIVNQALLRSDLIKKVSRGQYTAA